MKPRCISRRHLYDGLLPLRLLSVAILLAGGVAFYFLPVSALPHVDFPTITVRASLPGASPETMASSVATPLERQFGRIAGVTQMTSSSQLGSTAITLQFDLDRDINAASRDVQAAINAAAGQLPAGLPSLPTYRKVNPAETDILDLAVSSDTVTERRALRFMRFFSGAKNIAGRWRGPRAHFRRSEARGSRGSESQRAGALWDWFGGSERRACGRPTPTLPREIWRTNPTAGS